MTSSSPAIELPASASPALSFVVLLTRGAEITTPCLQSIAAAVAHARLEAEVVLVDARRDIEPSRSLRAQAGGARVVAAPQGLNVGTAVGWNLAFAAARAERVILLQEDARLAVDFLDHVLSAAEKEPRAAVVGARHHDDAGTTTNLGTVVWRDGFVTRLGPVNAPFLEAPAKAYEMPATSLAAALVNRDAWQEVGGFDERLFPTIYNDVDFCMAVRSFGWIVLCAPGARAQHVPGTATTDSARPRRSGELRRFLSVRNRERLIAKWDAHLAARPERPPGVSPDEVPPDVLRAALEQPAAAPDPVTAMRPVTGPGWPPATVIDESVERELLTAQVELLEGFATWLVEEEMATYVARLEEVVASAERARADAEGRLDDAGTAYRSLASQHEELTAWAKELETRKREVEAELERVVQSRGWRAVKAFRALTRRNETGR